MRLPVPFIQLPLKFDAAALAAEIGGLSDDLWRSHPSGLPGNTALPLVTVDGDPDRGDELRGPMRPTPALRKCRYVHEVIASLDAVVGRVRLMRLAGGAEVKPHVDTNHYWHERVRVHVPILTNPSVRFFCGEAQTHMTAGECWIFDTWRLHRVVNDADATRIHLVVDTVGSSAFGSLIRSGRPHTAAMEGWTPRFVVPGEENREPTFESVNLMSPMSYWELRDLVMFLLTEAEPHPQMQAIAQIANEFVLAWRTVWFGHGADPAGLPEYTRLLVEFLANMRRLGGGVRLKNHALFVNAVTGLLGQAVWDQTSAPPDEYATEDDRSVLSGAARRAASSGAQHEFERPVFIVSPPRSGSSLLFETLSLSPTACTIGGEGHAVIEGGPSAGGLGAAVRGYASNRLDADDVTPEIAALVRERFRKRAFDRQGQKRSGRIRLLEKTPKNALRVPFLSKVFPDAQFVYLHREPHQVLASMMEAWESGRFRTYPQLPGWTGLPWSMVLVPGWRDLIGKSMPEIVAAQWRTTTGILLDDLEALPPERWCVARYDELVSDPEAEIARLCESVGFEWDQPLSGSLPLANHTVSAPDPDKWRSREQDVEFAMARVAETAERAARVARSRQESALT